MLISCAATADSEPPANLASAVISVCASATPYDPYEDIKKKPGTISARVVNFISVIALGRNACTGKYKTERGTRLFVNISPQWVLSTYSTAPFTSVPSIIIGYTRQRGYTGIPNQLFKVRQMGVRSIVWSILSFGSCDSISYITIICFEVYRYMYTHLSMPVHGYADHQN